MAFASAAAVVEERGLRTGVLLTMKRL